MKNFSEMFSLSRDITVNGGTFAWNQNGKRFTGTSNFQRCVLCVHARALQNFQASSMKMNFFPIMLAMVMVKLAAARARMHRNRQAEKRKNGYAIRNGKPCGDI